jgi:DNA invertase Pin-like site-specific DNA recombinase
MPVSALCLAPSKGRLIRCTVLGSTPNRAAISRTLPAHGNSMSLMARSVDRLGRSLQDLVAFLSDLHALEIDPQRIDTSTPGGKAMFQMMGVFAEFERSIIQERPKAIDLKMTETT